MEAHYAIKETLVESMHNLSFTMKHLPLEINVQCFINLVVLIMAVQFSYLDNINHFPF